MDFEGDLMKVMMLLIVPINHIVDTRECRPCVGPGLGPDVCPKIFSKTQVSTAITH